MAEFHQNGKFERLKHDIPFRTQFAKNKQLKFKCGKGDVKTFIVVVCTLGSFTTILVGSFTLQCIKCNGAKLINKIVVNPHKRAWNEANCCSVLRLGEGGERSVQCTFSARPGKCQKSYTNKIVRNQFGVKFPLSTVVKTHIDSNIPIVITSPFG